MLKDLISNVKSVYHWGGVKTATVTPSTGVDLKGYRSALVLCSIGAITNVANSPQPSWTFALQESDTSNASFTNVATADVILSNGRNDGSITSGVFATVDAAAEDANTSTIGYIGTKRYIRVVATAANTPGNTAIAVNIVLGAMQAPVADA